MAFQDSSADLTGELISTALGDSVAAGGLITMSGVGSMTVVGISYLDMTALQMDGILSAEVLSTSNYQDSYAAMYGFGNIIIDNVGVSAICSDLFLDMETQELISSGCTIGDSDMITRYRGDDYPLRAILGKNGVFDVTGFTFKMSSRIESQAIFTSDGSVIDIENGIVEFPWPAGSIDTAGVGVYDIQGNDGTYTYTYDKGVFTLLDDVTV